jgi:predicted dehydrogenase
MKNQNILVCGAGSIGKRHIKNLKFLGEQVIVWRSRSSLIKKLKKELGVKVFLNLDEALKYSKAVVIATSTDNHINIALKALRLGKPIFIEKPISNNKKNINNLIKLGKKNII